MEIVDLNYLGAGFGSCLFLAGRLMVFAQFSSDLTTASLSGWVLSPPPPHRLIFMTRVPSESTLCMQVIP